MIWTLRIECVYGWYLEVRCTRVIEVDENCSLHDLHEAIQDAVRFGRDHPFIFFIANSSSPGAMRHWVTEKEEWEATVSDLFRIKIGDIYPCGREKLYYLFDFGDRWTFEIRKARGVKNPDPAVTYPRLAEAIGPNPRQYPICE
jgi:hypothetical protein